MSRDGFYQQEDDGIFAFVVGLLAGLLGGAAAGLLLAPKPGDALRSDTYRVARTLPKLLNEEFTNPDAQTRQFIAKAQHNLANQVGKVKKDRAAGRMAKAKEAEELASGYEFN